MKHGQSAYQRGGCKCPQCKEANRQNKIRTLARIREQLKNEPEKVVHGLLAYAAGCKCAACRAAHRDSMRQWRAKQRGDEGKCVVCGGTFRQKLDGTLWAHGWTGPYGAGKGHCLGSGQSPIMG